MKNIESLLKRFDEDARLEYYQTIDSTNIRAKEWAREGAASGSLVLAEQQTVGKGRLGKVWASPKETGLWMSLIVKPQIDPCKASLLTLIAGLSMCKAICELTHLEAKIKWPNDIVVHKKKVCGILTEMHAEAHRVKSVIIGIGVNVNIESFNEELPYATSLKIEGQTTYNKDDILKHFLVSFYEYYNVFIQQGFKPLIGEYKQHCVNLHEKVKLSTTKETFIGYVKDINEEGSLIVQDEQGKEKIIFTGEVSVRGLYGYV